MSNEGDISWYHGDSSREVAEEILLKGSHEDGTFLVRDSTTATGDYVLSVLQNREIAHYQIRRHGEDAFFSIEEQVIIHGLETLISYYQTRSNGLICKLVKPIKKNPPPPDSRLHGRTNLLHRATKEANITVVSELLKCGYRSLDAKNQAGETAVHLASKQNEEIILEKLISSGANVNCRDEFGNTPLHYACQSNYLSIVKILVLKGGANVQMRNSKSGWVAMHEAASRGHLEIIQFLLSVGAPARPRTEDNDTPDTLARANGYFQCVEILKAFVPPIMSINKENWYHSTLGRQEAIQILRDAGGKDGIYLVRFSDRTGYVLSMLHDSQPFNYPIETEPRGYFYIDNGPYLDSLEHVVSHYSAMSDGLPTTLQHPVRPRPKPPLPDQHPTLTRLTAMTLKSSSSFQKNEKRSDGFSTLPLAPKPRLPRRSLDTNLNTLSPEKQQSFQVFIPEENLIFKEVIGEGEFGSVYKAILQDNLGREIEVAVKTLRQEYISTNKEEFVREGKVLMAFNHHCIVRLIGLSEGNTLQMVQELMPLGSMLTYIHRYPERINPEYELYIWASQIALGMEYLEKKKFVHRDLAARNILLASKHQAKISDFGLSRVVSSDRDYYKATHGGKWPIKWYAPESYNFGTFSSASDIWSFGVTLWEMFSYGETPYGNMRGADAILLVEEGKRLSCPEKCSPELYATMELCWAYKAGDRPTFSQLVEEFRSHTSYENIKELILIADIA